MIERPVKKIHSDDAERFLLVDVRFIQHPDVDNDLARLAPRMLLETDAEPAVRFIVLLKTARRHGVGENKKGADAAELLVQAFDQQVVFVIEHGLEAGSAHVAIRRTVNRVAEGHVVGGHRFGDGPRRAAHVEKAAGHFLARADLGKGAVFLRVEVYLERFFVRPEIHFRLHPCSR